MIGFTRRTGLSLLLSFSLLASTASLAQEAPEEEPEGPAVAAVVNGDPVYVGEVDAGVTDTLKLRQLNREGLEHARADMLRDIISKRLIEQALEKQGGYVDSAAIDKEMKNLESRLRSKRKTLESFAAERNVSAETARHELGWPKIWSKYLERNLADELERYFNEHHKDLDGTTVRAPATFCCGPKRPRKPRPRCSNAARRFASRSNRRSSPLPKPPKSIPSDRAAIKGATWALCRGTWRDGRGFFEGRLRGSTRARSASR